jgi:hypothetical protein
MFNINFDEYYQIGYLNGMSNTEANMINTGGVLVGRDRVLAVSPIFQFGKCASPVLVPTARKISAPNSFGLLQTEMLFYPSLRMV